jgi:NAD(P)-dependent dehydrogenase (short-subunit alcohol dehydrogenase family)
MSQVWFITGASSGFGLDLALLALSAGHKVIGTVRNATKAADAVATIKNKGGQVLELDVTKAETINGVVEQANAIYGGVDILVNNAGYSLLGAVEDMRYVMSSTSDCVSGWIRPPDHLRPMNQEPG